SGSSYTECINNRCVCGFEDEFENKPSYDEGGEFKPEDKPYYDDSGYMMPPYQDGDFRYDIPEEFNRYIEPIEGMMPRTEGEFKPYYDEDYTGEEKPYYGETYNMEDKPYYDNQENFKPIYDEQYRYDSSDSQEGIYNEYKPSYYEEGNLDHQYDDVYNEQYKSENYETDTMYHETYMPPQEEFNYDQNQQFDYYEDSNYVPPTTMDGSMEFNQPMDYVHYEEFAPSTEFEPMMDDSNFAPSPTGEFQPSAEPMDSTTGFLSPFKLLGSLINGLILR
ncbi:hypothetical protein ACFL05_00965, partial [Patescibacteria group bacterium]